MKRLLVALMMLTVFMVCGVAWAGDLTINEEIYETDKPVISLQDVGTFDIANGSVSGPMITTNELADILKRCLEFVSDGNEDLNRIENTYAVYTPITRKSLASDRIKEAQEDLNRIERETALRRDIEAALKILDGLSQ